MLLLLHVVVAEQGMLPTPSRRRWCLCRVGELLLGIIILRILSQLLRRIGGLKGGGKVLFLLLLLVRVRGEIASAGVVVVR